MRRPMFVALLFFAATCVYAQEAENPIQSLLPSIRADVAAAAIESGVPIHESTVEALISMARVQAEAVEDVYSLTDKEQRIRVLSRYLSQKFSAGHSIGGSELPAGTITDFHWGYLAQEVDFTTQQFEGAGLSSLVGIESAVGNYSFSAGRGGSESATDAIMIPVSGNGSEATVTAVFVTDDKLATWTGTPGPSDATVFFANTTEGCPIVVKSNPDGAKIIINGEEWIRRTNTSILRKPGAVTVQVQLANYEDWEKQRVLKPGESWSIDVTLIEKSGD